MENNSGKHLKKELGVFSGISLVAGMTIGSGIYYLGSYVLERVNMSMGMALVCWIVGGIVSILGGLCFAELGAGTIAICSFHISKTFRILLYDTV